MNEEGNADLKMEKQREGTRVEELPNRESKRDNSSVRIHVEERMEI